MALKTNTYIDFPEQSSIASSPGIGTQRIYFKDDHILYRKNSDGIEQVIAQGGGGGGSGSGNSLSNITTSDDTETVLFSYTLPTDSSATIYAVVSAKSGTDSFNLVMTSAFQNDSGTVAATMGDNILSSNDYDDTIFQQCEFKISSQTVSLKVKGKAATTVDWSANYVITSSVSVIPNDGQWTLTTLTTTNDTETTLFSSTINEDNSIIMAKAMIIAVNSAGDKTLSAEISYSAYRDGAGAVESMGNIIVAANEWDEAVFQKCEFDCNSNDIRLRIQGAVATNISWKCCYMVIQQAGA